MCFFETHKALKWLMSLLMLAIIVSGCENEKKEAKPAHPQKKSEYPRNETLYIGGFDWASPSTFNPLDPDPNFPIDGNIRLMYESLLTYNPLNNELEPMLADSYSQAETSITVHLDSRAHWNDGTPVTTDDVLYTFKIDSLLPTSRHNSWTFLKEITADQDNNITFHLAKKRNPLIILQAIAETSILPKSVFEPLLKSARTGKTYSMEKIKEFKNDSHPIVSGPYNLKTYAPDKIVLEREPNYWGKVKYNNLDPAPKYIIHSIYEDNNSCNNAMTKGNIDISSSYMPRIWEKAKDSIRAWSRVEPYHLPGSITTLIIATQREPFNDIAFRKALAHAIDYEKIKAKAVSNYTPIIQPGFILPFGFESKYFNKEDANKYGYSFSTEKAKKILTQAGYSWNSEGKLLNKKKIPIRPISLECTQGWNDWEEAIRVIKATLNELGIEANEKFVDYNTWDLDMRHGTFDLAMKTQSTRTTIASPWDRFDQIMSEVAYRPIGKEAFSNQGRYKNSKVTKLLNLIPTLTDEKELTKAYRELNRIFMETVPVIAVMYRPSEFYQFSTKHWTNFPTEEFPYAPPHNLVVAAGVKALWKIKPVQAP